MSKREAPPPTSCRLCENKWPFCKSRVVWICPVKGHIEFDSHYALLQGKKDETTSHHGHKVKNAADDVRGSDISRMTNLFTILKFPKKLVHNGEPNRRNESPARPRQLCVEICVADSWFSCLSGAADPAAELRMCVCVCTPPFRGGRLWPWMVSGWMGIIIGVILGFFLLSVCWSSVLIRPHCLRAAQILLSCLRPLCLFPHHYFRDQQESPSLGSRGANAVSFVPSVLLLLL